MAITRNRCRTTGSPVRTSSTGSRSRRPGSRRRRPRPYLTGAEAALAAGEPPGSGVTGCHPATTRRPRRASRASPTGSSQHDAASIRRRSEPAGRSTRAGRGPGIERARRARCRRRLRLRHRRRGRERARGGEVLPGPVRAGLEDPPDRPAPGLRRATRTATSSTCPTTPRAGADVMTLRNGGTVNLDSDRHLERAAGRAPGHPGRATASRLSTCSRGRASSTRPAPRSGGTEAPPGSRHRRASSAKLLFPAAEFGTDTVINARNVGFTEPNNAAGWTAFMDRTPYSPEPRPRSSGSRPRTRT